MATLEQARGAKKTLTARLGKIAAVNGVGIARSHEGWCVRVNVLSGNDASRLNIPAEVNGVPVRTHYVGAAQAYSR